ncbi:hypothetical protein ALC57_12923 [Trachymyrmex cornetzi]|uniref:Uncharacterized protein n=1 Tax=Trachymyrmex cornetzi TaxID=471704 RepID=A0A195DQP0_9HYME|nr:hypothetical protein ALC57_12923 [Trachymyrmex cornetzi]
MSAPTQTAHTQPPETTRNRPLILVAMPPSALTARSALLRSPRVSERASERAHPRERVRERECRRERESPSREGERSGPVGDKAIKSGVRARERGLRQAE